MKKKRKVGKVYLIGAGPGDPKLITLRGKEILGTCDAVVYDYLAPAGLLSYSINAKKFYVGKKGGEKYSLSQSAINHLLKRLAQQGKVVARLKGGDPFIFGRGGEEALFLHQENIPFEVVPGVTAALGAAAYARIPLTHRDLASQVTFVTAHEDPSKRKGAVRWEFLAKTGGSLVFYMGVKMLPEIVTKLVENGLSVETPVAVVEWATTPHQRLVVGTLGDIVKKVKRLAIGSPALTLVGEVIDLRKRLEGFSHRPLQGKTVVITRARDQASALKRKLEDLGATVYEFPTIQILPPETWGAVDTAIGELAQYDWLIFTSANGVEKFMERVGAKGKDARAFAGIEIAAIGPATASKLREYHLQADLIPSEYVSESLAYFLAKKENLRGKKVLLVRADKARDYLKKELAQKGAWVKSLTGYRTKPVLRNGRCEDLRKRLEKRGIDFVTFTSSSTVKNFVSALGEKALAGVRDKTRWVTIGPITSKTARSFGLKIHRQARDYTIHGLVEAILKG